VLWYLLVSLSYDCGEVSFVSYSVNGLTLVGVVFIVCVDEVRIWTYNNAIWINYAMQINFILCYIVSSKETLNSWQVDYEIHLHVYHKENWQILTSRWFQCLNIYQSGNYSILKCSTFLVSFLHLIPTLSHTFSVFQYVWTFFTFSDCAVHW
jgi:hypothetical protein